MSFSASFGGRILSCQQQQSHKPPQNHWKSKDVLVMSFEGSDFFLSYPLRWQWILFLLKTCKKIKLLEGSRIISGKTRTRQARSSMMLMFSFTSIQAVSCFGCYHHTFSKRYVPCNGTIILSASSNLFTRSSSSTRISFLTGGEDDRRQHTTSSDPWCCHASCRGFVVHSLSHTAI